MSQKAGSEYEEIVITNYDPRRHDSTRHWQLNIFNLSAADEEEGKYTLIHEPTKELKQGGMNMTFIKYTSDGKAVIQPAALTLSGLDRRKRWSCTLWKTPSSCSSLTWSRWRKPPL